MFQAVNADDPQLRLVVALRLGGLLEQGGLLHDAAVVLRDAARVSTAFRYAALTKTRGEKDEFMRWISGSASQPSDDATSYTKRMEESEQVLLPRNAYLFIPPSSSPASPCNKSSGRGEIRPEPRPLHPRRRSPACMQT